MTIEKKKLAKLDMSKVQTTDKLEATAMAIAMLEAQAKAKITKRGK